MPRSVSSRVSRDRSIPTCARESSRRPRIRMSEHDDRLPLLQMLEHACEAVRHISARQREDQAGDRLLRLALERLVETVGEAANRVSTATRMIGGCFSAFQWGVSRGDPPGGSPGRRGRVATAGRPPGAGPGGRGERRTPYGGVPIGLEPTPPASLFRLDRREEADLTQGRRAAARRAEAGERPSRAFGDDPRCA